MKVYISGQISGLPKFWYESKFLEAELYNIDLGRNPINPLYLKPFLGIKKYWFYMISDLWALIFCDGIYMLNNWENSRGAKIEHFIAKKLKKTIIYEQTQLLNFDPKVPKAVQNFDYDSDYNLCPLCSLPIEMCRCNNI